MELQMGDFQPLAVTGNGPVRVYHCRAKMFAGRLPDLSSGNDDNWRLNTKHMILLNEQPWARPSGQSPGVG
jgi:hypothetical protein